MHILEAHQIVKDYSGYLALDHVSIQVPEGSIYGLLGPNGAGKTTFIRIINQITAPDSGKVLFKGHPLKQSDVSLIGYLPEERGLYKKMKVGEQALYLAQLKGMSRADALRKLKYWFEKFEIQAWWDKKVEELSKGMAQKVQFVTTILHDPKLLIFDEPFSGFDPINANLLKNEILELKEKGSTLIFSTHNMASVEELCDHITLINQSKVVLQGEIHQIRKQYGTNTFELLFEGNESFPALLPEGISVVSKNTRNALTTLVFQCETGISPNQLLSQALQYVHVLSYRELVPSMNDIFIKVVNHP